MTPEGQQRALASWANISQRAGGPFAPALPKVASSTNSLELVELLADFTVLDLEFQDTHLLEVAAIRYQDWEPVGEYVSLVRYREPIRPVVTQVCGISSTDVWDAPEEKPVLQQFFRLVGSSVLIAHNALAADKRVLEAARRRHGAEQDLPNSWLCTMAVAKQQERTGHLPKGQKCGLKDLCGLFGIDSRGHHQALRDVQMCYQVLRKLHGQQPITELITSTAKPKTAGTGQLFPLAA